ncbi:MAG TPA: hypothetical protein VLQ46_12505 [Casimicrobiaceae bacterium]|nr:hypothetical protein [Casimicrobiaceae bacterium]
MKRLVLAAVLAAGASGAAHADDSSMNPFTGESYSAFNGGHDRSQNANPSFNPAPSAWQQQNSDGASERFLQSNSAWGLAWKDPPVLSSGPADPSFRQTHPNGLTDSELQALSSQGPAWQMRDQNGAAMAGEPGTAIAAQEQDAARQSAASEPLGQRLARFFHVAPASTEQ